MKFSEMPYQRPDLDRIRVQIDEIRGRIERAASAQEQIAAYSDFETLYRGAETMLTIAYIRHSIDTRDPFYDGEQNFSDETMPLLEELVQTVNLAMLHSAFRPALEAHYGSLLFRNLEIAVRAFSPEILPLMNGLALLNSDREGNVVLKGIEGETRAYNGTDYTYYGLGDCDVVQNDDGTVDYNITIRDDAKFEDGTPITIDDVIFSMRFAIRSSRSSLSWAAVCPACSAAHSSRRRCSRSAGSATPRTTRWSTATSPSP